MTDLTNAELVLMGLLAEVPRHAYQLQQEIQARGMRSWAEMGFSSIYAQLNRLESAGLLCSGPAVEEAVEGSGAGKAARGGHRQGHSRQRRVYQLTAAGWQAYHQAVYQRLSHPRPHGADFDLALAHLPALSPEETRAALQTYINEMQTSIQHVQNKWQADGAASNLPAHVNALFAHSLAGMQAELNWVTGYLNQIKQED